MYVKPEHWDGNRERVKKHSNTLALNTRLTQLEERLNTYKMRQLIDETPITVDQVVAHLTNTGSAEDVHQFLEERYRQHPGEPRTLQKHRITLNYLKEFAPTLPFGRINYAFIKDFDAWLTEQPNKTRKGEKLSRNYINKILSNFQYYTTDALKRGILSVDPFKGFKMRNTPSKMAHLNSAEVEQIAIVDLSEFKPVVSESRDVFVFACYTGLRFQDLFYLTPSDLKQTAEGVVMVIDPKKTRNTTLETVQVNLSRVFDGKPLKIINPYIEGKKRNEAIFGPHNPETHNSEFNKHLKIIRKAAKIEAKLTAHVARHTCAMILLNEKGFGLAEIKTYLGHSDITTTQRYAKATYRMVNKGFE